MELYSEEQTKPPRFWRLEDNDEESFMLVICDEHGRRIEGGRILDIDKETGEMSAYVNVNPTLGLHLNESGRVYISS